MRHLIPAVVVALAFFSTAHAGPSPFSTKSFGDGNGYKHPDADVGQYFETKPQAPKELKPEPPHAPAKVSPEIRPVAAIPSRPRPRPFAPVPAAPEKGGNAPLPDGPALVRTQAPPAMAPSTAGKAPAAAAVPGSDDSVAEDARRDYETRLFGSASGPRRPELAGPQPGAQPSPAAPSAPTLSVPMGEGMLFVSLELDPQEAGTLRDAVAGLGAAAAFRPDARFQPMPGTGSSVRISGWLPASRLGDAISRPGVKRVEVERGSRPAGDSRVTGDYLLTVRVTEPSHPEESVASSVKELSVATGFKLDRVLGFETVPGGAATARVSGTLPVSQLSHALGLPGVIKIASALPSSTDPVPAAPARKEGFVKFVMARGLWLVLLTLLLALPTISAAVRKGLAVFVPYR